MPRNSLRWTSVLLGTVLYSLLFIFAYHYWITGRELRDVQPELLLFMLPGVIMALLPVQSPLKSTLQMAAGGTLLGLMLLNSALHWEARWLMVAWSLSGIFWAGCGALMVSLFRIMLTMHNQQ